MTNLPQSLKDIWTMSLGSLRFLMNGLPVVVFDGISCCNLCWSSQTLLKCLWTKYFHPLKFAATFKCSAFRNGYHRIISCCLYVHEPSREGFWTKVTRLILRAAQHTRFIEWTQIPWIVNKLLGTSNDKLMMIMRIFLGGLRLFSLATVLSNFIGYGKKVINWKVNFLAFCWLIHKTARYRHFLRWTQLQHIIQITLLHCLRDISGKVWWLWSFVREYIKSKYDLFILLNQVKL